MFQNKSIPFITAVLWLAACLGLAWSMMGGSKRITHPSGLSHAGYSNMVDNGQLERYFKPIEKIAVGDRVKARNPEVSDKTRAGFREPTASNWRKLSLEVAKPSGNKVYITLLRPLEWIEGEAVRPGHQIYLDMLEFGIKGHAEVISIDVCPPIQPGGGSVVTGTFRHTAADVLDIALEGGSLPIGATSIHPFWSEDRKAFISASKLNVGERLKRENGEIAQVASIKPRNGVTDVFNIEVFGEHVYYVSEDGILVHNSYIEMVSKKLEGSAIKRIEDGVEEFYVVDVDGVKRFLKRSEVAGDHTFPKAVIGKGVTEVEATAGVKLTKEAKDKIFGDIMNGSDNLRPMQKNLNSSKEARSISDWRHTGEGRTVNRAYLDELTEVQVRVGNQIREVVEQDLRRQGLGPDEIQRALNSLDELFNPFTKQVYVRTP